MILYDLVLSSCMAFMVLKLVTGFEWVELPLLTENWEWLDRLIIQPN